MARFAPILKDDPEDGSWFTNEAKTLRFEVLDGNEAAAIPVNVTGYALRWLLAESQAKNAAELLSKTTAAGEITITGVYNAVKATNTQRVNVAILAADTAAIDGDRDRWHELRRTDALSETVIAYGPAYLRQSAV